MIAFLRRLAVCVGLLIVVAPLAAEDLAKGTPPPNALHGSTKSAAEPSTAQVRPLPAEATTAQVLNFASRKLDFKATAGSIRLSDDKGAPEGCCPKLPLSVRICESKCPKFPNRSLCRRPCMTFSHLGGSSWAI